MIRNLVLFICSFFCTHNFFAQSVIKGKVSDKDSKETMPGVIVAAGSKNALTTVDGDFILVVAPGKQTFVGSLAGYKTFRKELDLKENDTLVLNIQLEVSNVMLDEVVISAGKYEQKLSDITVSMEVIKPDLLKNKACAQLDQIMGQVPGVYVTDGQVSIRGGSGYTYGAGSRVIMLVDEIPMMSADAGDIKFNYVPIENMEQVEVIKGASSALFGSSALSGVINMRTKYARNKPETQVTTMAGVYGDPDKESWNWWKARNKANPMYEGVTFSHAQKFGKLDLVIGGQYYNDAGYRDSVNEKRIRGNINLRYNFKKVPGLSAGINSTIMQYQGNLFFVWKDADHALQAGAGTLQNYNNIRNNFDPFVVYNSEKTGRHSLRGRYFLTLNSNHLGTINQSSRSELYYGEYQWQKRFKYNYNFTTGFVAMRQVVLSALYGNHFGANYAGYFQIDKKFFSRLTASFGARAEYYKLDTAQTHGGFFLVNAPKKANLPVQPVFRSGLNYQLFEHTFLRTSFGQGYRFPAVAEKYISTTVGPLGIFPNNSLQPEIGWSAEVGIKQGFKIGKFQAYLDVAGFVTHYYNMIDLLFKYDTVGKSQDINNSPNPVLELTKHVGFQFTNIGRANITGVDVSVNGEGKIGPVLLSILSGFTYTNPINPDFDPKKDTNGTVISSLLRYRNKTMVKNDAQITYKKILLGWSIRYNSVMQNIDNRFEKPLIYDILNPNTAFYYNPNLYVLPGLKQYRASHNNGVWINDLRIAFQATKYLKISFLVNNVLNKEFMSRPGLIEPPRTFVMQLAAKF